MNSYNQCMFYKSTILSKIFSNIVNSWQQCKPLDQAYVSALLFDHFHQLLFSDMIDYFNSVRVI